MADLDGDALGLLIDQALDALLRADGKPGLPTTPADQVQDRRRLFLAIGRGVVDYLHANPDAFRLQITGAPGASVTMHEIRKA